MHLEKRIYKTNFLNLFFIKTNHKRHQHEQRDRR